MYDTINARHYVFDAGPTLYKCYSNGLCLFGNKLLYRVYGDVFMD